MDNQFGESNTYSQRNTTALDNYDLDREWGYSLLDVPHRVNVNGTFVVPVGRRAQVAHRRTRQRDPRRLVGHDGRALPERLSRQRLAVQQQLGTARQLAAPQHRARRRAGHERIARRAADQLDQPRAFTAAPAYTFGNAPRTLPDLRTPGQRNVDLSVQKTQRVRRRRTISVRADVLNLFDNPLFTTLQSQFGTPTFGQLTAVGGYARSVQFQVRVAW